MKTDKIRKYTLFVLILLIIVNSVFLSSYLRHAKKTLPTIIRACGNREVFFLSDVIACSHEMVKDFIDTKSMYAENQNFTISGKTNEDGATLICYDNGGRIEKVIESDGTVVDYAYEYGKNGDIAGVTLRSYDTKIKVTEYCICREKIKHHKDVVSLGDTKKTKPSLMCLIDKNNNLIEEASVSKGGSLDRYAIATERMDFDTVKEIFASMSAKFKTEPKFMYLVDIDDKIVEEIIMSKDGIIDKYAMAIERIDFKTINGAFDDLNKRLRKARRKFYEITMPYYDRLEEELKAIGSFWGDLNIHMSNNKIIDGSFIDEKERRETIEEIVEYVYSMTPESNTAKVAKDKIASLEEDLRRSFILPNMEIYEKEVKEALEAFYEAVRSVSKESSGAIFVSDRRKVGAMIVLPSDENKEGTLSKFED